MPKGVKEFLGDLDDPVNFALQINKVAKDGKLRGYSEQIIGKKLAEYIERYGDDYVAAWYDNPPEDNSVRTLSRYEEVQRMIRDRAGVELISTKKERNEQDNFDKLFMRSWHADGCLDGVIGIDEVTALRSRAKKDGKGLTDYLWSLGGFYFTRGEKPIKNFDWYAQMTLLFSADGLYIDPSKLNPRFKEQITNNRMSHPEYRNLTAIEHIRELGFVTKDPSLCAINSSKAKREKKSERISLGGSVMYLGLQNLRYLHWLNDLYDKAQGKEAWETNWYQKGRRFIVNIREEQPELEKFWSTNRRTPANRGKPRERFKRASGAVIEMPKDLPQEIIDKANSGHEFFKVIKSQLVSVKLSQILRTYATSLKDQEAKGSDKPVKPRRKRTKYNSAWRNTVQPKSKGPGVGLPPPPGSAAAIAKYHEKERTEMSTTEKPDYFKVMQAARERGLLEHADREEARKKELYSSGGFVVTEVQQASIRSEYKQPKFNESAKTLVGYLGKENLDHFLWLYSKWFSDYRVSGVGFTSYFSDRLAGRSQTVNMIEEKLGINLQEELARLASKCDTMGV